MCFEFIHEPTFQDMIENACWCFDKNILDYDLILDFFVTFTQTAYISIKDVSMGRSWGHH